MENNKIYTNENTLTFRATDLTLDTSLPSPKLYFRKGTFAYIIEANDDPKKLPNGVVEYGEYDYSSIASNDLYTLEFDLEDIAGNSTTLSYNFYYDTISPVINVIQPIDSVTIGPDGTDIITEIHDNLSGTKELKMNISYGTLQQTTWYDPQSTVSSHWDPPMDVEMDNVVLTVVATDHCQNVSSTSVVLAVDTLAPRINLESSNISTSTVSATQVNLAATIVLNVQDENINFGTLDATMILTSSTILLSNFSTSGTVPDYVATLTFNDTVSSTDANGSIDLEVDVKDTLGNEALSTFNLK